MADRAESDRDSRCVSHRVKFSRKAVHPSAHFAADHAPHPGNKVFYFDLQLNRPIHTYPAGTYTRTSERKNKTQSKTNSASTPKQSKAKQATVSCACTFSRSGLS